MSVTYKFRNLNELAAYIEGRATEYRDRQKDALKKLNQAEYRGAAAALEMVAHTLRNTIIEEKPQ